MPRLEVLSTQPDLNPRPTPLLFIHGAWHGAWCWEEFFLPHFAANDYAAYALSLRGHSGSPNDKALRFTGVWDYVADVAEVAGQIERETGKRPVVIGHSMGGYVVQKYLQKHTAPGAVLLASIPSIGILPFSLRMLRQYPRRVLKMFVQLRAFPLIETPELAKAHFFSADVPLSTVEKYHARMQDEAFRILLDGSLVNLPRPRRIQPTPMLVIAAADDKVFTLAEEQATGKAYNTRTEVFPHIAHDVMLEPRWRDIADRVVSWLDEQGL
ncbi:MAG: alpha/beta fold hydrolase [bacterium]|nr:alpha/beta fold hydrolase [bacterium]